MNRQQIRQAARKKALEGQEIRRRDRAAKDKRLEALVVDVLVAVAERNEAILEAEQRAGVAVLSMQGRGYQPLRLRSGAVTLSLPVRSDVSPKVSVTVVKERTLQETTATTWAQRPKSSERDERNEVGPGWCGRCSSCARRPREAGSLRGQGGACAR